MSRDASAQPRGAPLLVTIAVAGVLAIAGFVSLGLWQLERRVWKHALIERIEARVHGAPVAAPGPAEWQDISAASHEYLRVRLSGRFDHARETLVQATTELGAGSWVLTPLKMDGGFAVLVNRGFVPPEKRDPASRAEGSPSGEATVAGLLRITEPNGAFLRDNDPQADQWRSRDVDAIAAKRGITNPAPYFVDADGAPNPGGWPKGGLTVVRFHDSHLIYALTWFGLAGLVAFALALVARGEIRARR